jgi:N-acetylmuramoyl-L-alanine amidase
MAQFQQKYVVIPRYLTKPSKRRPGIPMSPGVRFVVAHDTGNPKSTAEANVRYYERSRNEESASAHIFVDDRNIIECIPCLTATPEKAWHVLYSLPSDNQLFGYNANDAALGVEYCYGGTIDADEAYRKYVWLIAYSCFQFRLNPKLHIAGHFMLDPQRRTDPCTGLGHSRRTYEQLLRDVVQEYEECSGEPVQAPEAPLKPGTVIATVRLNIRKALPSTRVPVTQMVPVGTKLGYVDWTDSGEPINGNPRWYQDANGNYFWSGGVRSETT